MACSREFSIRKSSNCPCDPTQYESFFSFRSKIGPHINMLNIGTLNSFNRSYIEVVEANRVQRSTCIYQHTGRDFDVLPETLGNADDFIVFRKQTSYSSALVSGTINSPFYLETFRHVPDRQLKKINKVTSTMMTNGLYQFYTSFAEFKQHFMFQEWSCQAIDDVDFHAFTLNQLRRPMLVIFGLWALATICFIVEHIVYKIMYWLGCRVHQFNRNHQNKPNLFRRFIRMIRNRFKK